MQLYEAQAERDLLVVSYVVSESPREDVHAQCNESAHVHVSGLLYIRTYVYVNM